MTIDSSNYLNFGHILVNEFVGSVGLAIVLGLVLIGWVGVKNRLPIQVLMIAGFVWVGVILSIAYNAFVWMVALLVVAIIIYAMSPKVFNRR